MIVRRSDCDVFQMCAKKNHHYIDTEGCSIVAVVVKRLRSSINANTLTKAVNKEMKRMTESQ